METDRIRTGDVEIVVGFCSVANVDICRCRWAKEAKDLVLVVMEVLPLAIFIPFGSVQCNRAIVARHPATSRCSSILTHKQRNRLKMLTMVILAKEAGDKQVSYW